MVWGKEWFIKVEWEGWNGRVEGLCEVSECEDRIRGMGWVIGGKRREKVGGLGMWGKD